MIAASTYGAPNWVDLATPDVARATEFYCDLLGWTVESVSTPMGEYHIVKAGDTPVGGLMQAGAEQGDLAAVWTVFFYVADVDDTVAAIEQAGGALLEAPFDLPDGRLAVVADSSGAMFGLGAGTPSEGTWLSDTNGAVCWVELLTRDPAAAESFYAAVFGWKAETSGQGGGALYTVFTLESENVAGMMMMPDEVPVAAPAHWAAYFAVADCAEIERRAVQLGGHVLHPTTDLTVGRFAVIADPTGATFQLMEYHT